MNSRVLLHSAFLHFSTHNFYKESLVTHKTRAVPTARQRARREADHLFQCLRTGVRIRRNSAIAQIIYTPRFQPGGCLIAAVIPIGDEDRHDVHMVGLAQQKYHYQPRIITHAQRRCLRLAWRFQKRTAEEIPQIIYDANALARWIEGLFGVQAIVSPISGALCIARNELRLT